LNRELLETGSLCGHLVAAGSVEGFVAEHRRRLFPEALFADLFRSGRGRPSISGAVIATVMVLQSLRGLSDREAVRELRTNIAGKVGSGLWLTDEGFEPSGAELRRVPVGGARSRPGPTTRSVASEQLVESICEVLRIRAPASVCARQVGDFDADPPGQRVGRAAGRLLA